MKSQLLLLHFITIVQIDIIGCQELDKRRTSNVCHHTSECPINSFCEPRTGGVNFNSEGQCVCRNGYFMKASGKSRECIQIADHGELCYMNEQCEFRLGKESFCNNRQCGCKSNAHYIVSENACFNSSYIGEYCRLTSNCAVEKTTCQHSQCRCFYGYHPNSQKKKCLKDVNLNEACYSDDECVAEYSYCHGMCKCKQSHVQSKFDATICLPLATSLYQTCQQNSQCSSIPNSYCGSNSTCICMDEYHDINKRCWPSVRLNDICESDENCIISHSTCRNNRCVCDDGYYEFGKVCSKAEIVQKSFLIVLVCCILRLI